MLKKNNILLTLSLLILAPAATHAASKIEISDSRKLALEHLLKHDCGSCHGMTLKGGLGPSLLPESLKNKPDELLYITISEGRPGTPMPPWKSELSPEDINWIIWLLRRG